MGHIFISFLFYNILLIIFYNHYRRGDYYIKKRNLVLYTVLLIAFGTYGGGEGDYLHYKEIVESFHNIFDINAGGMEPQYYYLSYLVEGNYNKWRFFLYSIQFMGMGFLLYKAKLNTYPVLLSFITICLLESVYGRAFWGMIYFYLGLFLLLEKKNPLYLIPIILCYVSHTQNIALLVLLPIAFIDIKKWHIALFVIFAGPIISLLAYSFISYIDAGGIEGADYLNSRMETYSDSGGRGAFGNSFGEKIIFFLRYVPIVIIIVAWLRTILFNRKRYLTIYLPYRRVINITIGVFFVSILILLASVSSVTIFYRILAMTLFPVTLLLTYMKENGLLRKKSFNLYIWAGIICAEMSYVKDLYYAYVHGVV